MHETLSSLRILPACCFVPGRLLTGQVIGWPIQDSEGTLTLAQRSATEEALKATKSPYGSSVSLTPSPFIEESLPPPRPPVAQPAQRSLTEHRLPGANGGVAVRAQTPGSFHSTPWA